MLYLILSIVLTSSLFICFKWFDLKNIKLLPAISGNYMTCIMTGILVNGGVKTGDNNAEIILYCLLLGILFFAIFYTMGYASAKIGVGISSAAAKLSLVIPVCFGALILNERFGLSESIALMLILPAIILMTYRPNERIEGRKISIVLLIFAGSGIIDTSLNLLRQHLGTMSHAAAIALIFSSAFLCSLIFILAGGQKPLKELKSFKYGILLGLPNYFSVHFMLMALDSGIFSSGEFYMISNSGVIILSFGLAYILFSEKINLFKALGLALSITSIYLILMG
jgi:drug/metabolite transporter (DMT)-like permease